MKCIMYVIAGRLANGLYMFIKLWMPVYCYTQYFDVDSERQQSQQHSHHTTSVVQLCFAEFLIREVLMIYRDLRQVCVE